MRFSAKYNTTRGVDISGHVPTAPWLGSRGEQAIHHTVTGLEE